MESVSTQDFPTEPPHYKAGLRLGVSSCLFGDVPPWSASLSKEDWEWRGGPPTLKPHTTLNHKPALSIGPLMLMASHQQAHSILLLRRKVCVHR